jgi:hypothetical protein
MLFRALRYSSLLGFADVLAFERFDGVLQMFDKLAHDTDCSRLIFDLDRNLSAYVFPLCYFRHTNRVERRTQIRPMPLSQCGR